MTNKRKQLARSISDKTGMSYAGAINSLGRNTQAVTARISNRPFEIDDLFVVDDLHPSRVELGDSGFVQCGYHTTATYEKDDGDTALVIGDDRQSLVAVYRPKRVLPPIFLNMPPEEVLAFMGHLLLGAANSHGALPQIAESQVESHFLEAFPQGTIRLIRANGTYSRPGLCTSWPASVSSIRVSAPKCSLVLGVLGYAGIKCVKQNETGLVAFISRVRGVYVLENC